LAYPEASFEAVDWPVFLLPLELILAVGMRQHQLSHISWRFINIGDWEKKRVETDRTPTMETGDR
jgi:hypothetical protein